MMLTVFKSKLHRATVTGADIDYEGSISIDPALCEAAGFAPFERVEIYNINNGERFATYVIYGKEAGEIGLNGAAARLVHKGDKVIIVSYALLDQKEVHAHRPTVVLLDDHNRIKAKKEQPNF
ncbi:MAG: aspartate 1-decarboxylase [Bdellovibrionales bacterium RIFOXYD12_FULL_39_22]|nr:MAG: aspartate 1-decarboxylase [Bdellovibrionales bacterium RIFOXYB1_FULL_39_21]OFZ43434.1 MAG: aspartate 1-decarboxylase [Bdellovibrionales bacterium RIFOXYC12_FULL_39_17]OFZ46977.1 MAG: aspartate 1-decarboxylase [Bdellovibrionales bacterium RIFOXYC1_FULL_39_130]OFZ76174.1 MAG: aspartate 1-decarboxylase [Bdellovibrionales bacterium RIFOXYD1_FULL_39_84]OFZ94409.1 MAG: aspartate 1-decarboxylase [Bdellovibrionales bacterium RIFOXYD12_FULL_39_22]HLE10550.1 aspartate 1-decarboxylase [Bacteriovo